MGLGGRSETFRPPQQTPVYAPGVTIQASVLRLAPGPPLSSGPKKTGIESSIRGGHFMQQRLAIPRGDYSIVHPGTKGVLTQASER